MDVAPPSLAPMVPAEPGRDWRAQTLLTSILGTNSARTDVQAFEPDGIGSVGRSYYEQDREANYAHTAATRRFVDGLLGRAL